MRRHPPTPAGDACDQGGGAYCNGDRACVRDCGGPTCDPCGEGNGCFSADDCADGLICLAGVCAAA
ncbi:hypothetical protein [Haliangium sp.]|uniref:hypothetical protein n=1 Tax=Haliangium sp. TaxID=2663208 RepID=UPI003D0FDA93